MSTLSMLIEEYKRSQLVSDQLMASLERKVSGPTVETEIVDKQIEDVEFTEYCGTCGERDDECACNRFVRAL